MIIDGMMRLVTKGQHQYDRGGALAAKGDVHEGLLKEMLRHPFFRRRPPKSTGREQFGQQYCEWFYGKARREKLLPEDMRRDGHGLHGVEHRLWPIADFCRDCRMR